MSERDPKEVLRIFREFVDMNATQWAMGSRMHPMWALVVETLGDQNDVKRSNAEHQFIWPTNTEPL